MAGGVIRVHGEVFSTEENFAVGLLAFGSLQSEWAFKEFYFLPWPNGMLWSRINNGANSNYHYVAKNGHSAKGACIWITWNDVCWLYRLVWLCLALADILPCSGL